MTTSPVDRFRRRATGACLIAFPLSMLAAALVQPALGDEGADVYDAAVAAPGRIAASAAVGIPGLLLWVVAVAGAVHLVRGRGSRLAHVGGGLAVLGVLGHMAVATLFLALLGLPREADRAALVPALDRIAGHVFPVAMPLLVLGGIGLVLLAFGLWRAGQAPAATPALLALAFLSAFVPMGGTWGDVTLWLLAGTGLGLVGLRVLRMGDAAWAAPSAQVHDPRDLPAAVRA